MRTIGIVACALLCASSALHAQARRVLTGVVRDSATGEPLSGALVDVKSAAFHATVRSNQRGEFRISQVPGGDYGVSIRRLGYAELLRDLVTMDRDTTVIFAMTAVRRELDTVRVVARVNGIRGVVGTAHALKPIPGATVQLIGSGRQLTDSAGRFFIETKRGGTFLLRIAREGYAHQLVSIEVPKDGSVETATLLDSSDVRDRTWQSAWDDFDRRVVWRGSKSALVPGAELEELEGMSLSSALNASRTGFRRGMIVGPNTCVFVNGQPKPGFWVDMYDPEDVEAVELYGPGGEGTGTLRLAWPARAPCGAQQGGPYGRGVPPGNATWAVIWLKPPERKP